MEAEARFHAVVLAGGPREAVDPLAAQRGVSKKSLIPLAGKEMVRWVVDALQESGRIETLVLVGMSPEDGLTFSGPVLYEPGGGSMLDNMLQGLDRIQSIDPSAEKVVACSADVPLITPEMVRYFVAACLETDHDVYYSIVEQTTMDAQFPGSGRTFVPLKEGRFAGGDIYMARIAAARANESLLRRLIEERKNYLAQMRLIGIGTLLKLLFRQLDVAGAERVVGRALGLTGRAIISPYADLGMDVDKPHQLAMVEDALQRRLAQEATSG